MLIKFEDYLGESIFNKKYQKLFDNLYNYIKKNIQLIDVETTKDYPYNTYAFNIVRSIKPDSDDPFGEDSESKKIRIRLSRGYASFTLVINKDIIDMPSNDIRKLYNLIDNRASIIRKNIEKGKEREKEERIKNLDSFFEKKMSKKDYLDESLFKSNKLYSELYKNLYNYILKNYSKLNVIKDRNNEYEINLIKTDLMDEDEFGEDSSTTILKIKIEKNRDFSSWFKDYWYALYINGDRIDMEYRYLIKLYNLIDKIEKSKEKEEFKHSEKEKDEKLTSVIDILKNK